MAIKIYLTENQLNAVVKKLVKEEEMKEGIFDGISNVFQGLKGVWRGEGYDFFRYLNQLKNLVGTMKKHGQAIEKLQDLKVKVTSSKMSGEKKGQIIQEIDKLILAFQKYSGELSRVDQEINDRLVGKTKPIFNKGNEDQTPKPHIKKNEEELIDKMTDTEKRELAKYGYYDEDDYEDIFLDSGTNISNKISITIGGKKMDIEDKTKTPEPKKPERKKPNPFNDDPGKEPEKPKSLGFESGNEQKKKRDQQGLTITPP